MSRLAANLGGMGSAGGAYAIGIKVDQQQLDELNRAMAKLSFALGKSPPDIVRMATYKFIQSAAATTKMAPKRPPTKPDERSRAFKDGRTGRSVPKVYSLFLGNGEHRWVRYKGRAPIIANRGVARMSWWWGNRKTPKSDSLPEPKNATPSAKKKAEAVMTVKSHLEGKDASVTLVNSLRGIEKMMGNGKATIANLVHRTAKGLNIWANNLIKAEKAKAGLA